MIDGSADGVLSVSIGSEARPEYQTARDLPQISPQPCETYMEGDRNLVYVSGYVCGTHKHNQSTDRLQISSS